MTDDPTPTVGGALRSAVEKIWLRNASEKLWNRLMAGVVLPIVGEVLDEAFWLEGTSPQEPNP